MRIDVELIDELVGAMEGKESMELDAVLAKRVGFMERLALSDRGLVVECKNVKPVRIRRAKKS